MIFFIYTIKPIVFELNLRCTMTIYTPAHTQISKLFHFIILGNFTMTGLALYFSCYHMLCMIKVNEVWQIMYTGPFYWFSFRSIPGFSKLEACIFIQFLNFISSIYFFPVCCV